MLEKIKNNKKVLLPIIAIVAILIIGATYAWLTQVLTTTKVNKIKVGSLNLVLDDNASNGIDLQYAIPQSDSQGLGNTAYTFSVINNGSMNAKYNIYLEDEEIEGTRIDDSNIKYNLVMNDGEDNPKLLSTSIKEEKRVIDEDVIIEGGKTNTYSLKLWIDSETTKEEVANKVFKAKIKLEAIQTEENNDFVVKYDSNGGTGEMEDTVNQVGINRFMPPTKDKVFKEWNTKADGTGIKYTTSSTVKSSLKLYAIWGNIVYKYATVGDGPTGNGAITDPSQGRDIRPTDTKAYLKYETIDGEIMNHDYYDYYYDEYNDREDFSTYNYNYPIVYGCVYNEELGGEYCLKPFYYQTREKMEEDFGYDSKTKTISKHTSFTCAFGGKGVCYDSTTKFYIGGSGNVNVIDLTIVSPDNPNKVRVCHIEPYSSLYAECLDSNQYNYG